MVGERSFRARQHVECREPEPADRADPGYRPSEQADEPVREPRDLTLVARAPCAITRGDAREGIAASPRLRDQLGERSDVAQREIESLARDRMQRDRGVTDEHDRPATERIASHSPQRMQRSLPDLENTSEAIPERFLQRVAERIVRQ